MILHYFSPLVPLKQTDFRCCLHYQTFLAAHVALIYIYLIYIYLLGLSESSVCDYIFSHSSSSHTFSSAPGFHRRVTRSCYIITIFPNRATRFSSVHNETQTTVQHKANKNTIKGIVHPKNEHLLHLCSPSVYPRLG